MKVENFDTVEMQAIQEVLVAKQKLVEFKAHVEAKQQAGNFTMRDFRQYKAIMAEVKPLIASLESLPFIKFYIKYDYFRFTKNLHNFNPQ